MKHEEYLWYKSHGICVDCRSAEAVRGQTRCPDCKDKGKISSKAYYEAHKEEMDQYKKDYYKRTYAERLQAGVCTVCGKRPPKTGCKRCERCLARGRYNRRQRIIRKGSVPRDIITDIGICYFCCKNPQIPGKKICNDCLDKMIEGRLHETRNHDRV